MKNLCLICSLVLVFTACERHPVSELKSIDPQNVEEHAAKPEKEANH